MIHEFDGHFLVLTWAEDPDCPTWPHHCNTSPLDWDISHPPHCPMEAVGVTAGATWHKHHCFYQYMVDNAGVDAVEDLGEDAGSKPRAIPLAWASETVGWDTPEESQYIFAASPESVDNFELPGPANWRLLP